MAFSDRVKQLRNENKLSQISLAKALNISDRIIRYYEAGTMEPTMSVIIALSDFFNVSTDYILGCSDNRERQP